MYVIGGSDKKGEKMQDMFSFKLPLLQPYSMTIMAYSESLVATDFLKLVDLACDDHPASDLELFIQDNNDKPVTRLYSYLGLF